MHNWSSLRASGGPERGEDTIPARADPFKPRTGIRPEIANRIRGQDSRGNLIGVKVRRIGDPTV
jgi:hypothetical protein